MRASTSEEEAHSSLVVTSRRDSDCSTCQEKCDPVFESYKTLIQVINQTSNGFREGKKWKCNAGLLEAEQQPDQSAAAEPQGSKHRRRHSSSSRKHHHSHKRRNNNHPGMTHSRTVDERHLGDGTTDAEQAASLLQQHAARGAGLNRARGRRLVRQKATNSEDQDEALLSPPPASSSSHHALSSVVDNEANKSRSSSSGQHLRVNRGLPVRQWTVDTCTGLMTPMQENMGSSGGGAGLGGSTAYLLRPVSRNSIMSGGANVEDSNGQQSVGQFRRLSPGDRPRSPFVRSPVREKMRLGEISKSGASSFNHSTDASVSSRTGKIYEKALNPHLQNRKRLCKQRTSESAPMQASSSSGGAAAAFGGSSRHLPRQHSNASAYSAVLPTSYSHQGMTLVRGASCSLVDIPTYLGPSVAATGGVELAQVCDITSAAAICKTVPMGGNASTGSGHGVGSGGSVVGVGAGGPSERKVPSSRPRLQLDLTKRNKSTTKDNARKTQWTVLCVSVTLLTLAVTLVGTMLSVGSQYQDRIIESKQWDAIKRNRSRTAAADGELVIGDGGGGDLEPFVIVPDALDLEEVDQESAIGANETSSSTVDPTLGLVPIILPALSEKKTLPDNVDQNGP